MLATERAAITAWRLAMAIAFASFFFVLLAPGATATGAKGSQGRGGPRSVRQWLFRQLGELPGQRRRRRLAER